MVTLNMLTEVLRRHGIGDPVSKISVDLKTPESTIRDWLKFAQQHSLTFTKIAGMTLKQFKEIRAQSSQRLRGCYSLTGITSLRSLANPE